MGVNPHADVNYHTPHKPPAPPATKKQCECKRGSAFAPCSAPEVSQGDPIVSGIVAAATDNCVLGALAGGDILGAVIGDLMNDGELF